MSSEFGNKLKVTIFGESHGPAIGMVMDSPPFGYEISIDSIALELARRAPGNDPTATARKESDIPEFLSGLKNNITTGAPVAVIIRNNNTRSNNYDNVVNIPRPNHADYSASVRYGGFNDVAGGGHFSGRLTAPLCIAGSIAKQILITKGVRVTGHVLSIGNVYDQSFSLANLSEELLNRLSLEYFSTIDSQIKQAMTRKILDAMHDDNSIGGRVEVAVTGLPAGVGSPIFGGMENKISNAVFGVPAVKSVEFGIGDNFGDLLGSESNDLLYLNNDTISTVTNNCGGLTGGISNGMPIIIKAALKPTPSIGMLQNTLNIKTLQQENLIINGRHDPCIVPRALVAVEAAVAVSVLDMLWEVSVL